MDASLVPFPVDDPAAERRGAGPRLDLTLVVPTFNERNNVARLADAVGRALDGLAWEIIFVDDDSPDGTWREVRRLAAGDGHIRCIRRVGRKGLASAVVEGAMAASAEVIAVMDADFQHDESVLRTMFDSLVAENAELAVATRYSEGGSVGDWDATRTLMSGLATWAGRTIAGDQTSDPMSGFFMLRRSLFDEVVDGLSQQGWKILLDIIATARRPLRVVEVPYVFRTRCVGESKISAMVIAQYAFLLAEKLSHDLVPARFALFCLVGGLGLVVHVIALGFWHRFGVAFVDAQIAATGVAMVFNFLLNNEFTYYDRRLVGMERVKGAVIFCLICSIGALANLGVAELAMHETGNWFLAGASGALMGGIFNFSVSDNCVWLRRRRSRVPVPAAAPAAQGTTTI